MPAPANFAAGQGGNQPVPMMMPMPYIVSPHQGFIPNGVAPQAGSGAPSRQDNSPLRRPNKYNPRARIIPI